MTQLEKVTGDQRRWAGDMGYVGGVTSAVCTGLGMSFSVSPQYVLAATIAGVATGVALGAGMPALLERLRREVPLRGLVVGLGPTVGAAWGGLVGAIAWALAGDTPGMHGYSIEMSVVIAAIAGAMQFGLSWFPYTFQTVRGAARWPVLLGSTLLAPLIGTVAVVSAIVLFG